ncbi:bacteriocin family protein [Candidatus Bathyarchaeota archaeon]|nr:bacteriocin family protein [Candidatus Bathyarchaeota archaeon]
MMPLTRVGRDTGTLTTAEVNYIRSQVIKAAWPSLVGRTLMPTKSLGSIGYMKETYYTQTEMGQATISMTGEEQSVDKPELAEHTVNIPIISKDFRLNGRDIEAARLGNRDLNTQYAESAARQCAEEEDKLILSGEYTGWAALGIQGLASATDRNTMAGTAWITNYITIVAAAKAMLEADGHFGPKKLVIPSAWSAYLDALVANTAVLKRRVIEDLLGGSGNVVVSDSLFASDGGQDSALLIDTSPDNFELVVAEDYRTIGPDKQPGEDIYRGKVRVVVAPMIYRPTAICEITVLTAA